jgi:hypothetical protein
MAVRAKAAMLAGIVGGTKTHLGLYRVEGGSPVSLRDKLYATRFEKARRCGSRFSEWRLGDRRCLLLRAETDRGRCESPDQRCVDRISNRNRRPL